MSYDILPSGTREEYGPWSGTESISSANVTHQIIGPKGCVGFVRDVLVDVTTSIVGTTSVPEIVLGISSGDATFGRYRLGYTASLGYGVGMHRAGAEQLVVNTNNAGRQFADITGHVVLDGGIYTSSGTAGGSYGTVLPAGRIPASGMVITNLTGSGVCAMRDPIDPLLKVGQLVQLTTSGGTWGGCTGGPTTANAISAIDRTANTITLTAITWSGTYTGGTQMNVVVSVSNVIGVGSPAGNGAVRVIVDWHGGAQM